MAKEEAVINPKTKESIKREFMRMYAKKPLSRIRISDLIEKCSISKSTFYYYFTDITVLYHECERDMLDFTESRLSDIILSTVGGSFEKHGCFLAEDMKRYYKCKEDFKAFLTGSESASFHELWRESLRVNFGKALKFAAADMSPLEFDYTVRYFAGGHLEILKTFVLNDCSDPVEEVARIATKTMFYGSAPIDGQNQP